MMVAQKVSYLSWEISSCSKQLLSEPDLGVQEIVQLKLCYLYIRDIKDAKKSRENTASTKYQDETAPL